MIIYKLTNMINGKSYIGQTKHTIAYRMRDHRSGSKKTMPIARALKEYGEENFKKEILCTVYDFCMLDIMEAIFIKAYDTMDPEKGYNAREGGSTSNLSSESKDKLKRKALGNKRCAGRPWQPRIQLKNSIVCNENGKIYQSQGAAAKELGLHTGNINAVLKGRLMTTGGLTFKYFLERNK